MPKPLIYTTFHIVTQGEQHETIDNNNELSTTDASNDWPGSGGT